MMNSIKSEFQRQNTLIKALCLLLFFFSIIDGKAQNDEIKRIAEPNPQIIRPIFSNPRLREFKLAEQERTTEVPDLRGLEFIENRIRAYLKKNELVLGEISFVQDNSKINIIVEQSHPHDSRVPKFTPIDIFVGIAVEDENPEILNLFPNYIGLQYRAALEKIYEDGLKLENSRTEPNPAPKGEVIDQFPKSGEPILDNNKIVLIVSGGQANIRVPNLIGLPLDEAAKRLKRSKLLIGKEEIIILNSEEGIIQDQFPAANSIVSEGSSIDISFSARQIEEFTTVPNVLKLPKNEAIRKIKENGLNYIIERKSNSAVKEGIVFDQFPPPFEEVPYGSNVHIVYSKGKNVPPFVPLVSGAVVAVLAGGLLGNRLGKRRRKRKLAKNNAELKFEAVYDWGQQSFKLENQEINSYNIHFQFFPDKGKQDLNIH